MRLKESIYFLPRQDKTRQEKKAGSLKSSSLHNSQLSFLDLAVFSITTRGGSNVHLVLPVDDVNDDCANEKDGGRDDSILPVLPVSVPADERGNGETDHTHELNENVKGGSGGVLERVSHGITNNTGLVGIGSLATASSLNLNVLFAVVPGSTGVAHHDSKHHSAADASSKHANKASGSDEESDDKGGQDSPESGEDHLLDTALGRDLDALGAVGLRLALHQSRNVAELAPDLDDDGSGGLLHTKHGQSSEKEGEHGSEDSSAQDNRVGNVSNGDTGLLLEGSQQAQTGKDGRSNGKPLSSGSGGVSKGIERISGITDSLIEAAHLSNASGVVSNRPIGIGGKGHSQGTKHTNSSDGDSVTSSELIAAKNAGNHDEGGRDAGKHSNA